MSARLFVFSNPCFWSPYLLIFLVFCSVLQFANSQKRIGVSLSKEINKIPWEERAVITIHGISYFTEKKSLETVKANKSKMLDGKDTRLVIYEAPLDDLTIFYNRYDSFLSESVPPSDLQKEIISKGDQVRQIYEYSRLIRDTSPKNADKMLCVIFLQASLEPSINVRANMALMGDRCDWAIVLYGGDAQFEKQICENQSKNVVFCGITRYKKSEVVYNDSSVCHPIAVADTFFLNEKAYFQRNIPKSALYVELLPFLPNYRYALMMDEDISLMGFDAKKALDIWLCSSHPPPLIVQPLIQENTQFYVFLNEETWKDDNIIFSETGLVEQQVPIMSSMFLTWYIENVLKKVIPCALALGVDWGIDRTWCPAARQFGIEVLGWKNYTGSCGIIIGSGSVHHLNTKSITTKRTNPVAFRAKGAYILELYKTLFPSWIRSYDYHKVNPRSLTYGKDFAKIRTLNSTCVESRSSELLITKKCFMPFC